MATYVIVDAVDESKEKSIHFKNRHFSKDGKPLAQREFDRLRKLGQKVALVRWENNEIVAREV
jgi:hypothetical protein